MKRVICDWNHEYTIYDWLCDCVNYHTDDDPDFIETQVAQFLKDHQEEEAVARFDDAYNDYLNNSLGDEALNLRQSLNRPLIAFGELGLWNGKHFAFWQQMDKKNLNDIFDICHDDEWQLYGEDEDIHYVGVHHDGRNHFTIRKWKNSLSEEEVEELKSRFLESFNAEKYDECQKIFNEQTESIYPLVAKIYGWD